MAEDDPTREIFGYCSHIPVPKWVEKDAYNGCHHCATKFSPFIEKRNSHHCRLCGHMFCTQCTGKYYLPMAYELKNDKKGQSASRVCFQCRDSCLQQKKAEEASSSPYPMSIPILQKSVSNSSGSSSGASSAASSYSAKPAVVLREADLLSPRSQQRKLEEEKGMIEIAPPVEWEDDSKWVECRKCHKKNGKPHNCRACGLLYCDGPSCTLKMNLPPFFDKKGKPGPMRVCMDCRFKILGGAKLVERLTSEIRAEEARTRAASVVPGAVVVTPETACVVKGCGNVRISKQGYCAQHINEYGVNNANELSTSASISIRWDGTSHNLTKVALIEGMNLLQIDHAFRRQLPEFNQRDDFEYLYKGEGIHEVFYDLFSASHFIQFGNLLTIRKRIDSDLLVAAYKNQNVSGSPMVRSSSNGIQQSPSKSPTKSPSSTSSSSSTLSSPSLGRVTSYDKNGKLNPFKRQENGGGAPPPPSFDKKPSLDTKQAKKKKEFHKPIPITRPSKSLLPASQQKKSGPPPIPGSVVGRAPPPIPASAVGPDLFKHRAKTYFGAL